LANGVTIVFSFVVTFLILKVLDLTIGIRVSEEAESAGLDLDQHGETAYHEADVLMSRVIDGATALAGTAPKEREKVS